jgi:hypothetical protein
MKPAEGLVPAIIFLCALTLLIVWGGWELIDWVFIEDSIRASEPITPEIELEIRDGKVDTIYIYK